jgi:hypothetical protein
MILRSPHYEGNDPGVASRARELAPSSRASAASRGICTFRPAVSAPPSVLNSKSRAHAGARQLGRALLADSLAVCSEMVAVRRRDRSPYPHTVAVAVLRGSAHLRVTTRGDSSLSRGTRWERGQSSTPASARCRFTHASSRSSLAESARGRATSTVVPRPTALSIVSRPPCAAAVRHAMARPSPAPSGLVE